MARCWRLIAAVVLLAGAGCGHLCPCCRLGELGADRPPAGWQEAPPPRQPPGDVVPPVGPRPGTGVGAYGGSDPLAGG
jgi:hypothetical protein